jgi:hypothetical protein
MPSRTITLFRESRLLTTTTTRVMILGRVETLSCCRIIILSAILLSTFPTPGPSTALSEMKDTRCFQATSENIGTGIVLQTPAITPRTLLGIHSI